MGLFKISVYKTMWSDCPDKHYYDEVVGRCTGCHDICYGVSLHDINSDCNRFCPDMMAKPGSPDDNSNTSVSSTNVTEIILLTCSAILLVSVLLGVVLWRRFRSRRQMSQQDPESQEITAIQETDEDATTTPVRETGMSELYIGNYPSDPMLSTSEA